MDEFKPRKRITLSLRLPAADTAAAYKDSLPLFAYVLRMPDVLVAHAHFRAEVQKRLRATREAEQSKLRKIEEEKNAEERKLEADKTKKAARDSKLKGMSADEQRKYLDREREKGNRKGVKKIKG